MAPPAATTEERRSDAPTMRAPDERFRRERFLELLNLIDVCLSLALRTSGDMGSDNEPTPKRLKNTFMLYIKNVRFA
jgi:hypothetical protein